MTAGTGFGRGRGPMRTTVLAREFERVLRAEGPGVWSAFAACRGLGDVMFPDGDECSPVYRRGAEIARAVCAGCPARASCLGHALTAGEDHGVWGGTTPEERRAMRRRAREAKGA